MMRRGRAGALLLGVVASLALVVSVVASGSGSASHRLDRAGLASAYGRLPLAFEPNRGQFDPRILYAARGAGYTLSLTRDGPVLALSHKKGARSAAVSLSLLGESPQARLAAQSPLPGHVNYLIGNQPSRWHTNIPTYGRISYQDLWPGISATFYGHQGQLEYDFNLAPGADPNRIGLAFSGQSSLHLDRSGALALSLPGGGLRQLAPAAYQLMGGTRHAIESRYLIDRHQVRIALGAYDHSRRLIVDPALAYSTYLGGSSGDTADGIAADSKGAAYLTGHTSSTDFPATGGAYQTTNHGGGDAFVTKLSPNGKSLAYSTYLGGSSNENGDTHGAIAVDSSGSAYVTGSTRSTDFPTTTGAYQTTLKGFNDAFVTKLSPDGKSLAYSTYLGGANLDAATGIAVDSAGAAYVTGSTESTDFPTSAGAFQAALKGRSDAFVTKLATDGKSLAYSTYLGGSAWDFREIASAIAVDTLGHAYVTGQTTSTDFPTTPKAMQTTLKGTQNAFVTELATDAKSLAYSTYLGGTGSDEGHAIAVDPAGAAYVTGVTYSTDFPTTSRAYQTTNKGSPNAFVTKLSPNGQSLSYSTYLGGSNSEFGNGIGVQSGAAYVTGVTRSTDFPTSAGAYQSALNGPSDAFVTKLAPDGMSLAYSSYLGGSGDDGATAIAVDSAGSALVAGQTSSTDFPITSGAYQTTNKGAPDAFVTKLTFPAPTTPTHTTLVSSRNPSLAGQRVTYTAKVSPSALGGTVTFTDHGVAITGCGNVPLGATHTAVCRVTYPKAGTHSVRARYSGTATFALSTSSTLTQVVKAACVVPNLVGKTLAAAKTALQKAHCTLGTVTKKKSAGKAGIVLSQKPAPGKRLPAGSKVAVVVSKQ